MKNVIDVFHNQGTFVIPIGPVRDDVPELCIGLLNYFGV